MTKKINKVKTIIIAIISVAVILVAVFFVWANNYYKADSLALQLMEENDNVELIDNLSIINPSESNGKGIIFYPGAKVEATAYLPLLDKLSKEGFTCVLVKMPLNMAIFDVNTADKVFDKVPEIKSWYVAGHSMGGAMASKYASNNKEKVDGLVVMGAYVYGDYPTINALTIYGSYNSEVEKNIDYTDNIIEIYGGNHAKFGNYGKQKGDPDGTITTEEQQKITVEAILNFVEQEEMGIT